jgi:hypothetical protein
MLGLACRIERLPMGNATAGSATNRAERAITLDVFLGVLRMAFNLNRTEVEIGPD